MAKRCMMAGCALAALIAVASLAACGSPSAPPSSVAQVSGAGSTFVLPLYQRWASDYRKINTGVQVVYGGGGSGFGQSQIEAGAVSFGGSDQPLSRRDLDNLCLVQFPTCVGGVVPVVHLTGIGPAKLKLTGTILANIFLGKIHRWNDPRIEAVNKGLVLPAQRIAVVHRADTSGTTWIFTNYLARVSGQWAKRVGSGTSVLWPRGISANGNPGVTAIVKTTPGAIGYVEYAYAKANKLTLVELRNKAQRWVRPTVAAFAAAASSARWSWANGFYTMLVNAPGSSSWPVTGASWVLIRCSQQSQASGATMLRFFDWCYRDPSARRDEVSLNYVPLPASVVGAVEAVWAKSVKAHGKPCWP